MCSKVIFVRSIFRIPFVYCPIFKIRENERKEEDEEKKKKKKKKRVKMM